MKTKFQISTKVGQTCRSAPKSGRRGNAALPSCIAAFTLVEILIVVIILGILAAIVIPQFTNASNDARNNSVASTLQLAALLAAALTLLLTWPDDKREAPGATAVIGTHAHVLQGAGIDLPAFGEGHLAHQRPSFGRLPWRGVGQERRLHHLDRQIGGDRRS